MMVKKRSAAIAASSTSGGAAAKPPAIPPKEGSSAFPQLSAASCFLTPSPEIDCIHSHAVEEARASPAKRSVGGFADEDDLLDWEGFVEPPSKRAKPDTAPPAAAASEASPRSSRAQASTASSSLRERMFPTTTHPPYLTRELLEKGKGALARMHLMIFPKLKQDKTLVQLIEAFAVDTKEVIETYALAAIVNKKSEIAADVERYALTELHKATDSLNWLQPPLRGGEHQREKSSPAGRNPPGKFLPEGEIDAIAIVIELDIISIIIIIIISTIYTAITTAAPRHRCISMNEVRKKLFTISLSGKAAHWYKLLKNGDSIDWEDIVPLFYSKFYPPNKTLLDTSCSGSFTRKKEEFKRDLLDRIQENTEGWENDKDRESGIIYDYKCIEAFMDTDKFRNMSATYGLDSQVVANLYKAFASHYELPKKNFDKYHEPYKDKVDSSVNKCVVIETVDNVIPEAYIEKTPFPAKMKEYSVISSAVNKSEKKPKEPEEQIKIEPAVAIVKDLVTENVEDGHIIFCEDASNIVSHPNKPKQVSVPMLSVRIGDHCYYGLCDIGASVSAIPYELYTEIMHEIGSCELEDIDVVIHLANRETISPIGIVRDVEVLCGKIKYPADFLVLGSAASDHCPIIFGRPFLNTCGAIIDCKKEKILTRFAGEPYEFNFSKFTKTPYKADLPSNDFKMEQCASIVLVPNNPLQQHLENSESEAFRKERDELEEIFLRQPILKHDLPVEDLGTTPPPKEDPVFDLKPLPDNLKYAHIDDKKIYPVIISSKLSEIEEERLLEILKKHRGAIGYTLDDLKGISPSICQHAINMEEDAKPVVEHQRRLIPKMKEVRCEETNLVLNWEKCHFMVNEGIVLGHKISERGIEVDRAKVEAIEKMPYPRDVKDRKGADNPVADNLSRLENIAYDPVPVNDSFPNEQLAVIKGALPPALDLDSFPCVEEAIRVADEFCDQYRALRREVEILQEENQRLRRMLEYYSNPSTRPSPPHSGNNESLQVLVQNCKIEKLKLKEILMKREKNPSPSSPKE
ncbi:hypothetical protein QYE76_064313 [Lolium multiflorum]|uniref:Retrotransposon gag domain-containing protein n=1 Tax=Lolium multiflorum TaxID=4521 RepID=A0AAD8S7F4_LOLMU|nr:hypothetical protein QYE76_064313 [Lolium multiflorum]